MSNLTITNNTTRGIPLWEPVFDGETLSVPGAVTYVQGTVLARKTVADAVVAAADGGNTGDGVATLTTVADGPIVPLVGAYNLEIITAIANGGVFKLEDPNGALVATELVMTVGAGATTAFEVAGLKFSITDGATDFAAADKFSLTVAADGKVVIYSRTGAGGAQIPLMVLFEEEVFTGSEDRVLRPIVGGRVRRNDLVVHGSGAITDAESDALRDFGITPLPTTQLAELDNQ